MKKMSFQAKRISEKRLNYFSVDKFAIDLNSVEHHHLRTQVLKTHPYKQESSIQIMNYWKTPSQVSLLPQFCRPSRQIWSKNFRSTRLWSVPKVRFLGISRNFLRIFRRFSTSLPWKNVSIRLFFVIIHAMYIAFTYDIFIEISHVFVNIW